METERLRAATQVAITLVILALLIGSLTSGGLFIIIFVTLIIGLCAYAFINTNEIQLSIKQFKNNVHKIIKIHNFEHNAPLYEFVASRNSAWLFITGIDKIGIIEIKPQYNGEDLYTILQQYYFKYSAIAYIASTSDNRVTTRTGPVYTKIACRLALGKVGATEAVIEDITDTTYTTPNVSRIYIGLRDKRQIKIQLSDLHHNSISATEIYNFIASKMI
jgi:hypothetical protein